MRVALISSFRKNCGIGIYTFEFVSNLLRHRNVKEVHLFTHTNSNITIPSRKLRVYKVVDEKYPFYVCKLVNKLREIEPDIIDVEWDHSLYSPTMFFGVYIFPLLSHFKEKIFLSFHSLYRDEDLSRCLSFLIRNKPIEKVLSKYYSLTKNFLLKNLKIGRLFTLYQYEQIKKYRATSLL